jgi:hypothetical protein
MRKTVPRSCSPPARVVERADEPRRAGHIQKQDELLEVQCANARLPSAGQNLMAIIYFFSGVTLCPGAQYTIVVFKKIGDQQVRSREGEKATGHGPIVSTFPCVVDDRLMDLSYEILEDEIQLARLSRSQARHITYGLYNTHGSAKICVVGILAYSVAK